MALPIDVYQTELDINCYVLLVSFMVLYYDYILNLPAEIESFWNRKGFTWASFLFFVNRYLVLFGNVPVMVQFFWYPQDLAHKNIAYHQFLLIVSQIVVGVLLIMRVYAMYGRSRWIAVMFVVVAAVDVAVGCWAVLSMRPPPTPSYALSSRGCNGSLGQKQGNRLALAWMGQLAFDALVFALTLYKSFILRRNKNKNLMSALLRDGSLYFAVITAANLANILAFVLAPALSKGIVSTFTNIISATMIARLMLNLRDPEMMNSYSGQTPDGLVATTIPVVSTVIEHAFVRTRISDEGDHGLVEDIRIPNANDIEMIPRGK